MMKSKEMFTLHPDSFVMHEHYGLCRIKEVVQDFGVVILPQTENGKRLLSWHSDMSLDTPLMEHSCRMLKHYNY